MQRHSSTPNCLCLHCGKAFHRSPCVLAYGKGKFCSRSCSVVYQSRRMVNVACQVCGKPLRFRPRDIERGSKHCSLQCRWLGNQKRRGLEARFWAKVQKSDDPEGCWLWIAATTDQGYGQLAPDKTRDPLISAHRLSWEIQNGPIPEGLCCLHDCDVRYPIGDISYRACVRPSHLFLGTNKDNTADMIRKGRHPVLRIHVVEEHARS